MWGRLGPRFALEAAFLILLAVGLGLADQDWPVVVAVMAGGWALVSLIELIASRRPPWPVGERPAVVEGPPALPHEPAAEEGAAPAPEPVVEEAAVPPPELEPEPEPVAEEVAPPGAEEPVLPEAPVEPEPAAAVGEETQEVPLPEERPQRRRW